MKQKTKPPLKLLFQLFLPFSLSSGLPTLGFLSLEYLLLLGNLNPSLLVVLNDPFWPGLSVSNFFSLFLLLSLSEFFSWVELSGFFLSGQESKREKTTLNQLPKTETQLIFHKQLKHTSWQMNLQAYFLYH